MRTKEEWDAWYAAPNPWGTEGTDKDRVREDILLERLRRGRFTQLLDLGCGEGRLTNALSTLSAHTQAYDISERAVERARSRFPHIAFGVGDMLDVLTRPDVIDMPFDLVTVSEVLYYFQTDEERRLALSRLARIGAPECLYYFSAIITGSSKHRRYFSHDEFIDEVSRHFNIVDAFPSVADLPPVVEFLRRHLLPERRRLQALRAWTLSRGTRQCRHLGLFAVKRGTHPQTL
jgi:SAM-dependent methyltransferase